MKAAWLSFVAVLAPVAGATAALTPAQTEFFEQKIRPVLVAECYECHAGDKQKGGLVLDSRVGWEKGGDSGAAIVPGDPEKSLLVRSLTHEDADLKMPKKAPKLAESIIADFRTWVKMGAPDPREVADAKGAAKPAWPEMLASRRKWWAFQPVSPNALTVPPDTSWSAHPIDRLLLAKMKAADLHPSAEADARTILRRLHFALTGLPPSPEELARFLTAAQTDRAAAIAAATDALLSSPAFGERWARHWMDLARYAETYGSEHDYLNPFAWRYRDYLIRAFNDDVPYDRFVQEQIAGDQLEPRWNRELAINEAALGTAWQRMIESYATPVDVKREEASIIDWQIEALGKTFLGLTVQCARCHDHKFDPISAADYYALYGVFASTRPMMRILDEPAKLTRRDPRLAQVKAELRPALAARWHHELSADVINAELQHGEKDALDPLREIGRAPNFAQTWKEFCEREAKARASAQPALFADFTNGDLAGWRVTSPGLPATPAPAGLLSLATGAKPIRAIQPTGYYSDTISERHGGVLRSPEFTIEKHAVSVLAAGSGRARLRLVIENFQNDLLLFSGVNPDLKSPTPTWVTMRMKEQWIGRRAHVEVLTRDEKTCVGYVGNQDAWDKSDGRSAFGILQVALHEDAAPANPTPFPAALAQGDLKTIAELVTRVAALATEMLDRWAAARATNEDARFLQALLEAGLLTNELGENDRAAELLAEFRALETQIPNATRAPGVGEDGFAADSPLFPRGDHLHPGATIPRRFLEVLGAAPLGTHDAGRLALARELSRPENPLTARVMANRIWQHLTGRGLVSTPDNFGRMGEAPAQPELLDHLAARFVADGWSVKKLIRYIVTSRTWQLSSEPTATAAERDAANELLTHASVRRLDAETLRDTMLAVAGNLHSGHDGPGVPVFYRTRIDPDKQPPTGPLDGNGRRSVYLEARRLFPSEFLATFDAPKPNIFTGARSETNVPAQSLALLNDPFVLHEAEAWAQRLQQCAGDERERIRTMYLTALARPPSDDELERATAFVQARAATGWRDLAHAIFNLKEFLYLP